MLKAHFLLLSALLLLLASDRPALGGSIGHEHNISNPIEEVFIAATDDDDMEGEDEAFEDAPRDLRQYLDRRRVENKSMLHDISTHGGSSDKMAHKFSDRTNDMGRMSHGGLFHDEESHRADSKTSIDRFDDISEALAEAALAAESSVPGQASKDQRKGDRFQDEVVHDQLSLSQKEILEDELNEQTTVAPEGAFAHSHADGMSDGEVSSISTSGGGVSANQTEQTGMWYYYRDRCLNVYAAAVSVVGIGIGVSVAVAVALCCLWLRKNGSRQRQRIRANGCENLPEDPNELKTK